MRPLRGLSREKEGEVRPTLALLIESLWNDGASLKEIAERTGLTKSRVYSYIDDHRAACPYRQPSLPHARIVELWNAGLSASEIAAEVGATDRAIYAHAHRYRDEMPRREGGRRKVSTE